MTQNTWVQIIDSESVILNTTRTRIFPPKLFESFNFHTSITVCKISVIFLTQRKGLYVKENQCLIFLLSPVKFNVYSRDDRSVHSSLSIIFNDIVKHISGNTFIFYDSNSEDQKFILCHSFAVTTSIKRFLLVCLTSVNLFYHFSFRRI